MPKRPTSQAMRRVLDELQVPEAYRATDGEWPPTVRWEDAPAPPLLRTGRKPIPFNPEVAEELLERLECGEPMFMIWADEHMPGYALINKWRRENETFNQAYSRAREASAEACEHRLIQIVMTEQDVSRAKLQADSLFRVAAIRNPKTHGQKTETTLNINVGLADRLEGAIRRTEQKTIESSAIEVREIPSDD